MSLINPFQKDLNQALNLPENQGDFLQADWAAPKQVKTLITTRKGGVSTGAYTSFNLGAHVGDDPKAVKANREKLQNMLPHPVCYLNQTHSTIVVNAIDAIDCDAEADANVDTTGQVVCAVMTADCLPVLLTDQSGTVVAAAHAGWRGLVNGILENTIDQMNCDPLNIMAFLGPAIGPDAFEVGQEVVDAFCQSHPKSEMAFFNIGSGKYLANIYQLARIRLQAHGVHLISGGDHCTVLERDRFFSYRREQITGRMVSAIWLEKNV